MYPIDLRTIGIVIQCLNEGTPQDICLFINLFSGGSNSDIDVGTRPSVPAYAAQKMPHSPSSLWFLICHLFNMVIFHNVNSPVTFKITDFFTLSKEISCCSIKYRAHITFYLFIYLFCAHRL